MPAVVFLDQRDSRVRRDLVTQWVNELNHDPALDWLLPFERTAGDEMQALTDDPETLREVSLRALESQLWWLGVGVGDVAEPLPTSVREAQGEAFNLGREAIEAAKSNRGFGLRVMGRRAQDADDLEAALTLANVIYETRPTAGGEAARLRDEGLSSEEIAKQLGITRRAANARLKTARWREEEAARTLILHIAERLLA